MKRLLLVMVVTLMFAGGTFAQTPSNPPQRIGRGQRQNPGTALKNALGLTDAQVSAITTLVQNSRTQFQTIQSDIRQKRQALDSLLSAASPSPVDVGNAAIALRAAQNAQKTAETALINQIKQQLTGDQQQKLDAIIAANGGRGLIPGLRLDPGGPGPQGRGARKR